MPTYSEHVSEWSLEDWNFVGEEIERRKFEEEEHEHDEGFREVCPDRFYPMMNYCYPLEHEPSDEVIVRVHEKTGCTVVQKRSTGDYYLALTGGGMDMSQDVGLAYLVTDDWIPTDLVHSINIQKPLTMTGESYRELLRGIKRTVEAEKKHLNRTLEEVEEQLEKQEEG